MWKKIVYLVTLLLLNTLTFFLSGLYLSGMNPFLTLITLLFFIASLFANIVSIIKTKNRIRKIILGMVTVISIIGFGLVGEIFLESRIQANGIQKYYYDQEK